MAHKIRCSRAFAALIGLLSFAVGNGSSAAGDPKRGAQVFQACMACHSVKAGEHMTGPSLARVWNHKAATAEGFFRYSDALKHADIVWNEPALDKWLANPEQFVPGTSMTFPGVKEGKDRQDVIAYLKAVSENKALQVEPRRGGMMMQSGKVNLKKAPPAGQVVSISHCGDTYSVKTADGKTSRVWEFNLRFKTDSSKDGPLPGKPVIVGAGMQGDRASVVFVGPAEISNFIRQACE
ncbi:MAG TPA: c-type cytochrome [Burkholderiales bacterium]|nr:c-type cytochrome [Burkholderiales bacterium]